VNKHSINNLKISFVSFGTSENNYFSPFTVIIVLPTGIIMEEFHLVVALGINGY